MGLLRSRRLRQIPVAVDGLATHAHRPRDVGHIRASQLQAADGVVLRDDARLALLPDGRGALHPVTWSVRCQRPGSHRGRQRGVVVTQTVRCGGRLTQDAPLGEEHLLEALRQVVEQMPSIDDLPRLGCAGRGRLDHRVAAITGNHRDLRMLPEPGADRGWLAIPEQIHYPVPFQIDDDRAVAMPATPGPVVNPDGVQGAGCRERGPAQRIEERVGAERHSQGGQEPPAGFSAQGQGDGIDDTGQPGGAACRRRDHVGEPLGEDLPGTGRVPTEPAARGEVQLHGQSLPGEIGQAALIPAMDAIRRAAARGAVHHRAMGTQDEGDRIVARLDGLEVETGGVRIDGRVRHGGKPSRATAVGHPIVAPSSPKVRKTHHDVTRFGPRNAHTF